MKPADKEKLHVLLVEDNPGDVELVRLYLAQGLSDSVQLSCAKSLEAAEEAIEPGGIDLVLLDLGLPDGNGVGVVGSVRRMASDLPIVVLTGSDQPDAGLEALKSDAQDYLLKDQLSASVLRRSIRYAVERHRWQQQFRHQLSVSPDGIIVIARDGEIRFANSAATSVLGEVPTCSKDLPHALVSASDVPTDVRLETGRIVEVRSARTDWQGRPAQLITLRDMTDRRRAEESLADLTEKLQRTNERLEELVSTDPLTEVLNRRGMEAALSSEMDRMRRTGDQLTAVLVDCDNFKGINDTHGHAVGDAALKRLTEGVRQTLRAADHVARVGGDEFLVLLPGTTLAEGMAVAEKIRRVIRSTRLPVAEGELTLSASLAVGLIGRDVVSIEQVLATVNSALKRSKQGGKDRVSAQLGAGEVADGLEADTENVDPDEIDLGVAFQTIRRVQDGVTVGYEALTRGPPGGFLMPSDLFRAAYEQNVLTAVDLRALAASLQALSMKDPEAWHHVNMFPTTLLNTPTDELARILGDVPSTNGLCVELSEQRFLGDPSYLVDPIRALREHGIRIAIDDVGFGRSSIEALLLLEPDVVKVDRRCIESIVGDAGERRQFERLIAMLDAVGATVIIEGVENEEELAIVRETGVRFAQGFLWDTPIRDS